MKKGKTTVFVKAMANLAENHIERRGYYDHKLEKYISKSKGCCQAITLVSHANCYWVYFDNIFSRNKGPRIRGGYYFGDDIPKNYTSRIIALQLAQILWDEGQTF